MSDHRPEVDAGPGRDDVALARLTRPLLELLRRVSGLETTFVTEIDWAAQRQRVVLALNTADLVVPEGAEVEWSDSMCRWAFLAGTPATSDVAVDYPGSIGADDLGMQTFVAVPVLSGEVVIGTV